MLERRRRATINDEIQRQIAEWAEWLRRNAPTARQRLHDWLIEPSPNNSAAAVSEKLERIGITVASPLNPPARLISELQKLI
jgi:hypothetical protein